MGDVWYDLASEVQGAFVASRVQTRLVKQVKTAGDHYRRISKHQGWMMYTENSRLFTLNLVQESIESAFKRVRDLLHLNELAAGYMELEKMAYHAVDMARFDIEDIYDRFLRDQAGAAQLRCSFENDRLTGTALKTIMIMQLRKAETKTKTSFTKTGDIPGLPVTVNITPRLDKFMLLGLGAGYCREYPKDVSLGVIIWSATRHHRYSSLSQPFAEIYLKENNMQALTKSGLMLYRMSPDNTLMETRVHNVFSLSIEFHLVVAPVADHLDLLTVVVGYCLSSNCKHADWSYVIHNPRQNFGHFHSMLSQSVSWDGEVRLVYANPNSRRELASRATITWDDVHDLFDEPADVLLAIIREDIPSDVDVEEETWRRRYDAGLRPDSGGSSPVGISRLTLPAPPYDGSQTATQVFPSSNVPSSSIDNDSILEIGGCTPPETSPAAGPKSISGNFRRVSLAPRPSTPASKAFSGTTNTAITNRFETEVETKHPDAVKGLPDPALHVTWTSCPTTQISTVATSTLYGRQEFDTDESYDVPDAIHTPPESLQIDDNYLDVGDQPLEPVKSGEGRDQAHVRRPEFGLGPTTHPASASNGMSILEDSETSRGPSSAPQSTDPQPESRNTEGEFFVSSLPIPSASRAPGDAMIAVMTAGPKSTTTRPNIRDETIANNLKLLPEDMATVRPSTSAPLEEACFDTDGSISDGTSPIIFGIPASDNSQTLVQALPALTRPQNTTEGGSVSELENSAISPVPDETLLASSLQSVSSELQGALKPLGPSTHPSWLLSETVTHKVMDYGPEPTTSDHSSSEGESSFDTKKRRAALARVLAPLEHLRVRFDHLKLGKKLDAGGFAEVWQATWHESPPSEGCNNLVVKKLSSRFNNQPLEPIRLALRFTRELQVWSTFNHPNILPCKGFDIDVEKQLACFVSPYMPGGSIRARLNIIDVTVPEQQRVQWVVNITAGLKYLHSLRQPVVHGDLKAANFLLSASDVAVICDFGVSSIVEDTLPTGLTTSEVLPWSTRWCSPEVLDDEKRTTASDIWSLGMSILEIMTGRWPFYTVHRDPAIITRIVKHLYPTREEYPELSPNNPLWGLIDKCLVAEPQKRATVDDCWRIVSSLVVDV